MLNKMLKNKFVQIVLVIAVLAITYLQQNTHQTSSSSNDEQVLFDAIKNERSDVQVRGIGKVFRLLPDDNIGSRHQKFLIDVKGRSLLISHNIDLAPRINDLKVGDEIEFYGEFEWNNKGGVVHWTHHDPRNKHPHGYIKHNGKTYQ